MGHKLKKNNTQKHKKINNLIFPALIFINLIIFALGCESSLPASSNDFETAKINTPWATAQQIIQENLTDSDPLVRVRAIEVVATTNQLRLMPLVQQLLRDSSMPVRFAAAVAVGDLKYTPAKREIFQLLEDKDANVIIAAAYAMTKLGSKEYLQAICKAIGNKDQKVRANAAFLLGKTEDTSSLELLKKAQEDKDSSDMVKFIILEARARLGDEDVLERLWSIVYSGYNDDRILGIRAMGALGSVKARNILIEKLDDDLLQVRLVAAEQLGMLRSRAGEPQVLDVFKKDLTAAMDKETAENTNVLTALAIGHICTPNLTKFLPQLLQNESKFVRIAAAKAVLQCMK